MSWIYLVVAGIMEIAWAVGMKYSQGFTRPLAGALTIIGMVLSVVFLSYAMRTIPLGTAYAVWTGIGAVGTAVMGILLFHESAAVVRLLCILLIITGIVGLYLFSKQRAL